MQQEKELPPKINEYGSAPHIKNIINLLNQNCYSRRMHDVFRDFVEITAIALSNVADKVHFEEREAKYMTIIKRYSAEEVKRFPEMFAELTMAYEMGGFDDVLGSLYMQLELGNERAGQFFTPYHLCRLMGKIAAPTKESINSKLDRYGFIEANDPCVGAGAMMVALAQEMIENGINYQHCLHVSATDIDITAVHMAYIQFTMFNIPAVITWGNTLTLEEWGHWYTFAHITGRWQERIGAAKRVERMINFMKGVDVIDDVSQTTKAEMPITEPKPPAIEPEQPILINKPLSGEQITLF